MIFTVLTKVVCPSDIVQVKWSVVNEGYTYDDAECGNATSSAGSHENE